jgi:solute carrier family 25 carnitine/acylcarnitine transporter 20/29
MDSLMLGSLTLYRRLLNERVFNRQLPDREPLEGRYVPVPKLPAIGHALAGVLAGISGYLSATEGFPLITSLGWTVSFIAAPVEHVKARLQVQYGASKASRLYSGPIDCSRKLYKAHGVRGLYHGLSSTLLFRTFFFFWWGSYDLFTSYLSKNTDLSTPMVNFFAGGLSAQMFWITSYPSDVVKQRIMTDELGEGRKFRRWRDAAKAVYKERGWRGYWRGFVPCFLRAFPANAAVSVDRRE